MGTIHQRTTSVHFLNATNLGDPRKLQVQDSCSHRITLLKTSNLEQCESTRRQEKKSAKHPAAIGNQVKFWLGNASNFNQPSTIYPSWYAVCTILEGPLGSFLSTSHHNHLPSCLLVWHKCRESIGLILPWLKFASKSVLQIYIKVGSLVSGGRPEDSKRNLNFQSATWHQF
jgi:hypothetical protein